MIAVPSLAFRRAALLALAGLCALGLVVWQAPQIHTGLGTAQEIRAYSPDEAQVVRGIWRVWSHHTLDYQKAIHTGYYYYTSVALGAALVPWLGNTQATFTLAARIWSLAQGAALIVLATALVGALSGWQWPVAFLPVFLALDPEYNELSSVIRVDISMWMWMFCALWALSRFLERPDRRRYRAAVVFATLAFAAKPAVLPYAGFFLAANAYQVWRDGLTLRGEWRWRTLKGLQYFAVTLALAAPFTFFSPGLFAASMRDELRATATKFLRRPATDWILILSDPTYLGAGVLLLGIGVGLALALLWWRRRLPAGEGPERHLRVFAAVCGLWAAAYWGFVLVESRSFIPRYLDPALMGFLGLTVAGLCLLARLGRAWAVAALVAVLLAYTPSIPVRTAVLVWARGLALQRDAILAPNRRFAKEFKALIPRDTSLVTSADVLIDEVDYPRSVHIRSYRPRYFAGHPLYLVMKLSDLDYFDPYEGQSGKDSLIDAERAQSAVFYNQVQHSLLYGTLEPVKTWDDIAVTLYRFKVPVDEKYVAWLQAKVESESGVVIPGQ